MDKPYRNLIREVAYAQYAVRDQSSILGILWSFLNPLLMMALLFAYFHTSAGRDVKHYGIFLLIGMIHYTHFSNATGQAMNMLIMNAQLTRNTILPKEVLVIGSVLSTSVEFLISMLLCLAGAWFMGIQLGWTAMTLIIVVVLQMVFVMWVSLLLAAARVFVKDLSHIYQVVLRLLFLGTPIFYAASFVENPVARQLMRFNPLATLIGLSRMSIIEGHGLPAIPILVLLALHLVALVLAFYWFKRRESAFAEYV